MSDQPTRRKRVQGTDGINDATGAKPSPRWWAPVMVTLMIVGLLWAVVFYLSAQKYPIPDIKTWNLLIAFGIMMAGFAMTTRWR